MGFAYANTRAELAVQYAKRMLRENINPSGELDNVKMTRAVLQYRNTPERDTGLSPAYMILPVKPNQVPPMSTHRDLASTWQDVAEWRELALAKRSAKNLENLSTQVSRTRSVTTPLIGISGGSWLRSYPTGSTRLGWTVAGGSHCGTGSFYARFCTHP
jgi:hypothetical protein